VNRKAVYRMVSLILNILYAQLKNVVTTLCRQQD